MNCAFGETHYLLLKIQCNIVYLKFTEQNAASSIVHETYLNSGALFRLSLRYTIESKTKCT